jgi:hypothetical protein
MFFFDDMTIEIRHKHTKFNCKYKKNERIYARCKLSSLRASSQQGRVTAERLFVRANNLAIVSQRPKSWPVTWGTTITELKKRQYGAAHFRIRLPLFHKVVWYASSKIITECRRCRLPNRNPRPNCV